MSHPSPPLFYIHLWAHLPASSALPDTSAPLQRGLQWPALERAELGWGQHWQVISPSLSLFVGWWGTPRGDQAKRRNPPTTATASVPGWALLEQDRSGSGAFPHIQVSQGQRQQWVGEEEREWKGRGHTAEHGREERCQERKILKKSPQLLLPQCVLKEGVQLPFILISLCPLK